MATETFYLLNLLVQLIVPLTFALVCEEGPPGVFCSDDMKGFHDCRMNKGRYINRFIQCPEQTKCTCYLERACGEKEAKNPCQVYFPAELDSVYTMRLKGRRKTVHGMGTSRSSISATWSFDKRNKMSMKRDSDGKFELVVPKGQNTFDVYEGLDGYYCDKSTVSIFSNPINLDLYRFIGPETVKRGGVEVLTQKWRYARGRRHNGQQLVEKTWLFAKEERNMPMRPVRFSKTVLGTQYSRTNQYFNYDVSDYVRSVSGNAFRIPDVCQDV